MKRKKEEGIQRLTVSEVLKKDKVLKEDIKHFTDNQHKELTKGINDLVNNCEHGKQEGILNRFTDLYPESKRREIYERNHVTIIHHLHKYIMEWGTSPSTTELKRLTGLSRLTVTRHLNEYQQSELSQEEKGRQVLMSNMVLNALYRQAIEGNLKASKLFLQFTRPTISNGKIDTYVNQQQNNVNNNNYEAPNDTEYHITPKD